MEATILERHDSVYSERHPTGEDVVVVIEVANTSLRRDQTTKQRVYAKADIPTYLVVNLNAGEIEIHQTPISEAETYRERRTLTCADTLTLQLGESTTEVPVADLLP